jgi:hypothetical protein
MGGMAPALHSLHALVLHKLCATCPPASLASLASCFWLGEVTLAKAAPTLTAALLLQTSKVLWNRQRS